MPLTDILFSTNNSIVANRGNIGVLVDSCINDRGFSNALKTRSVTAAFKMSATTFVDDGVLVNAFDSVTHAWVGSGSIAGGAGEVTMTVSTLNDVYLVADPSDAALTSLTVCTLPVAVTVS